MHHSAGGERKGTRVVLGPDPERNIDSPQRIHDRWREDPGAQEQQQAIDVLLLQPAGCGDALPGLEDQLLVSAYLYAGGFQGLEGVIAEGLCKVGSFPGQAQGDQPHSFSSDSHPPLLSAIQNSTTPLV